MSERRANRLAALGLLWAFGVTLGRGLRRPNDWAEAHWLISYDFGFIKRGLAGSLLAHSSAQCRPWPRRPSRWWPRC